MKSSGIGKRVQIVYKVNNSSPFWIRQEWITRIPVNQTNSINFIAVVKVSCFEARGLAPWILKFDIFLSNFKQKRLFSWFRDRENEIDHFWPLLEKSFLLPWKNSLLIPLEKILSMDYCRFIRFKACGKPKLWGHLDLIFCVLCFTWWICVVSVNPIPTWVSTMFAIGLNFL